MLCVLLAGQGWPGAPRLAAGLRGPGVCGPSVETASGSRSCLPREVARGLGGPPALETALGMAG